MGDDTANAAWPAGTVHRDGEPVACWFAVERIAGSTDFRAFSMTRDHGGQVHHFVLREHMWNEVEAALAAGMGPANPIRPLPFLGTFATGVRMLVELRGIASGEHGYDPALHAPEGPAFGGGEPARVREAARDITEATSPFTLSLDPEAVSFVGRHVHDTLVADGCWWGIDATFGKGAPMMAAMRRWPYLATSVGLAFACHRERFAEARDGGALMVAEAMTKGVPMGWAARNIDAIHAAHAADVDSGRFRGNSHGLDRTLAAAGLVPPTARPRDGDLAAFLRCAPAVTRITWAATPADMGRLLQVGRDWSSFEARLASACGGIRPARAVRDVEDMLVAFKRQVLSPTLHVHAMGGLPPLPEGPTRAGAALDALRRCYPKPTVAVAALLSGRSLVRCIRDSARWHAGQHRISALAASLPGTLGRPPSWPACLPGHAEGNLAAVVLTDAAALADEGREGPNADGTEGLDHCVGGYAVECVAHGTRIVSIRRPVPGGFERLSTAQVAVQAGKVVSLQHSGRRNGEPPPEATALLDSYLATLGQLGPWAPDAIPGLPGGGKDPCASAGYDWFLPGNLNAVARAWAPFLPRALRGLSPAGWAALEDWAHADGPPAWRRTPFKPSGNVGART